MKISEILRKAADKHLSPTSELVCLKTDTASCLAVSIAEQGSLANWNHCSAVRFLFDIGLEGTDPFLEFYCAPTSELQGARFLWLDFAALVAEDWENGEIEL